MIDLKPHWSRQRISSIVIKAQVGGVSAVAAGAAADAILELLSTTLARPPVAPEAQGLVEELDCLHVWPQSIADHHADTLTPRQIEKLYAIGEVATRAAALITAQASQLEETRAAPGAGGGHTRSDPR